MMITKDEAIILAEALSDFKYECSRYFPDKHEKSQAIEKLTTLQHYLERNGVDKRRQGRTSMNDFSDVIKRYCKLDKSVNI